MLPQCPKNFCYETSLATCLRRDRAEMLPVKYVFMLTNECNLSCSFCFMEHVVPENRMTFGDWVSVLDQLPDYARVIFMGGEPLFSDQFLPLYREAASRFRISIVTNGTLLTTDLIDVLLSYPNLVELGVSIDQIGNQTRNVTESQWRTTMEGCCYFSKRKAEIGHEALLSIKTVILDATASQLYDLHCFSHEVLGCDCNTYGTLAGSVMQNSDRMRSWSDLYMPAEPYFYKRWRAILTQLRRIRAYNKENDHRAFFRPKVIDLNSDEPIEELDLLNQRHLCSEVFAACATPRTECRIFSDGTVTTCLAVPLGNVRKQSLRDIVDGQDMQRFRAIIEKEHFVPQCTRCNYTYHKRYCIDSGELRPSTD